MHIVGSFTSGYFSFYDDEYEFVHYNDDDDHVWHDIEGLLYLQTSDYNQLARL